MGELSSLPQNAASTAKMRANRSRDTKPEIELRSLLHRSGFRFRIHRKIETSEGSVRPDVVFPTERLAVFVDGCFWHACPIHGSRPKHNQEF